MSGSCDRGFTLIEVVIALTIIAVAFTVLLETLSFASSNYEEGLRTFETMLLLDGKLKRRDHEGLQVKRTKVPDFPAIEEVVYSYGGLFFVRYEQR